MDLVLTGGPGLGSRVFKGSAFQSGRLCRLHSHRLSLLVPAFQSCSVACVFVAILMIPVALVVALQPKGLDYFLEGRTNTVSKLTMVEKVKPPGWNLLMIHHTGFLRPVCSFLVCMH